MSAILAARIARDDSPALGIAEDCLDRAIRILTEQCGRLPTKLCFYARTRESDCEDGREPAADFPFFSC